MIKRFLSTSVLFFALGLLILFNSCKKEDDNNNDDNTPTPTDTKKGYSGSASYGDLVTFEINQTQHTYSVHNETTGLNENGAYSLMNGELNGIYKITNTTSTFYAVELTDKIIAANFPTGRPDNNISFGVSSSINNVGNEANIAGSYIYVHFWEGSINGNVRNKEWGVVSVNSNGTINVQPYATGGTGNMPTLAPENFSLPLPLTTSTLDGLWSVNGTHHERINASINQQPGSQFTGFANSSASTPVFILDMGVGNGFLVALKINTSSIAQVAGLYKFVGVVADGSKIANNVTVSSNGTATIVITNAGGTLENESLQGITQCQGIPNTYYADHYTGNPAQKTGKLYVVITGDVAMYFIFDNQGLFNAYGAGAKMN